MSNNETSLISIKAEKLREQFAIWICGSLSIISNVSKRGNTVTIIVSRGEKYFQCLFLKFHIRYP